MSKNKFLVDYNSYDGSTMFQSYDDSSLFPEKKYNNTIFQSKEYDYGRIYINTEDKEQKFSRVSAIKDPRVCYCLLFPIFSDELYSVGELASALGVNRFRLHHVFAENVGIPLKLYMRTIKVQLAAMKLLTTADKTIDISFSIGYDSQEAFIRAFKRHFQLTPGAYKKILGKKISFCQARQSEVTHKIHLSAKAVQNDIFNRDELGRFMCDEVLRYNVETGNAVLSQAPLGSLEVFMYK